jgi:hypothetical protein
MVGVWALAAVLMAGQGQPVPQPFPRPGPAAPPVQQQPSQPASPQPGPPSALPGGDGAPTEATLGMPIFPGSQFIASYDAGRGQRFYLFGTTASFVSIVAYYRSVLKQKGDLVFDVPATHEFDVGKFD